MDKYDLIQHLDERLYNVNSYLSNIRRKIDAVNILSDDIMLKNYLKHLETVEKLLNSEVECIEKKLGILICSLIEIN